MEQFVNSLRLKSSELNSNVLGTVVNFLFFHSPGFPYAKTFSPHFRLVAVHTVTHCHMLSHRGQRRLISRGDGARDGSTGFDCSGGLDLYWPDRVSLEVNKTDWAYSCPFAFHPFYKGRRSRAID